MTKWFKKIFKKSYYFHFIKKVPLKYNSITFFQLINYSVNFIIFKLIIDSLIRGIYRTSFYWRIKNDPQKRNFRNSNENSLGISLHIALHKPPYHVKFSNFGYNNIKMKIYTIFKRIWVAFFSHLNTKTMHQKSLPIRVLKGKVGYLLALMHFSVHVHEIFRARIICQISIRIFRDFTNVYKNISNKFNLVRKALVQCVIFIF